ncbi:DUF1707 SHOCT-like domain-containing protein [Streptomyces sp. NRRL B-3648]|uniref:DUF1707 SHOCT-like domain-containing protein n=1 Tax=Streptomyces sp. NRRL B-3648 TaxID=1519493 RepID=UPI000A4F5B3F|nr:DUF1707 domain-containing protein [Streptomyces sp. NRRL B-3648]
MADDLERRRPPKPLRVSDAERERVVEQLKAAVGEGRISLAELDQRLSLVYSADTRPEVDAVLADLPSVRPPQALEVRRVKSFARIDGRWEVPEFLTVGCYDAVVRLDFRQASIGHPAVRIDLSAAKSIVRLQLPAGASVSVHGLVVHKGLVRNRVADPGGHASGTGFTITGQLTKALLFLR